MEECEKNVLLMQIKLLKFEKQEFKVIAIASIGYSHYFCLWILKNFDAL